MEGFVGARRGGASIARGTKYKSLKFKEKSDKQTNKQTNTINRLKGLGPEMMKCECEV